VRTSHSFFKTTKGLLVTLTLGVFVGVGVKVEVGVIVGVVVCVGVIVGVGVEVGVKQTVVAGTFNLTTPLYGFV
jgi:hypothetical protein